MSKTADHTLDMYENPQDHSFREIAHWTGCSVPFMLRRAAASFIDGLRPPRLCPFRSAWREAANTVKQISLERDW